MQHNFFFIPHAVIHRPSISSSLVPLSKDHPLVPGVVVLKERLSFIRGTII